MFRISINCDGEEVYTFYYKKYENAKRAFELFNKHGEILRTCGIIENYYVELRKDNEL